MVRMNPELRAKIKEEAHKYIISLNEDDERENDNGFIDYIEGTKSQALINWLVPYVVELARENHYPVNPEDFDPTVLKYTPEEINAKVWEEIGK